jgi:hypothetical protein
MSDAVLEGLSGLQPGLDVKEAEDEATPASRYDEKEREVEDEKKE